MQTLENIKSRRSVRQYSQTKKITPEQIYEVVECWLYAPSADNQQARKYYIITKQEDLNFLWDLMERWKMIPSASWVILACFDENKLIDSEFIQQDMWASIENIRLAANEKWYWMVRVWTYPNEKPIKDIKKHFKLDDNITPFAILPIWIPDWEIRPKNIQTEWKITIL
jgi:nitroreductase